MKVTLILIAINLLLLVALSLNFCPKQREQNDNEEFNSRPVKTEQEEKSELDKQYAALQPGFAPLEKDKIIGKPDTYGYTLQKYNQIAVTVNTPGWYNQATPLVCSLHITDKMHSTGGIRSFTIMDMNVQLTDNKGKPTGTLASTKFTAPEGEIFNTEFSNLPDKYKSENNSNYDFCQIRTYKEKAGAFPAQLYLHYTAKIDIWGKLYDVNDSLLLNRSTPYLYQDLDYGGYKKAEQQPQDGKVEIYEYVPAPGETIIPNQLISDIAIYKFKQVWMTISPLRVSGSYLNSACSMELFARIDMSNTFVPYTLNAMDMWITDLAGKRLGIPKSTKLTTPQNTYNNVTYDSVPSEERTPMQHYWKFTLTKNFNDNVLDFPEQIYMHCYAEITLKGENTVIDKKIKLIRKYMRSE